MRLPLLLLLLADLPASAAYAQSDYTGTGGGPLSTQTAPNTTATGTTKPPSRDASPTERRDPDLRTARERANDKIDESICIGCAPK